MKPHYTPCKYGNKQRNLASPNRHREKAVYRENHRATYYPYGQREEDRKNRYTSRVLPHREKPKYEHYQNKWGDNGTYDRRNVEKYNDTYEYRRKREDYRPHNQDSTYNRERREYRKVRDGQPPLRQESPRKWNRYQVLEGQEPEQDFWRSRQIERHKREQGVDQVTYLKRRRDSSPEEGEEVKQSKKDRRERK
ncbi:Hypothetical predicted protein [Pelobates cultripes]|uniref:Uncharacterized protein n=1 Tax=Pelobates cultripes TaxID=61616 RepID=A0AAD1RY57_PELCU|nr:Hypothetical predicted protein [Pelobates cultripes]